MVSSNLFHPMTILLGCSRTTARLKLLIKSFIADFVFQPLAASADLPLEIPLIFEPLCNSTSVSERDDIAMACPSLVEVAISSGRLSPNGRLRKLSDDFIPEIFRATLPLCNIPDRASNIMSQLLDVILEANISLDDEARSYILRTSSSKHEILPWAVIKRLAQLDFDTGLLPYEDDIFQALPNSFNTDQENHAWDLIAVLLEGSVRTRSFPECLQKWRQNLHDSSGNN